MDALQIISSIISGLAILMASSAIAFAFGIVQRITRVEAEGKAIDDRLKFIYERVRFTIATDLKSNPRAEDEELEALAMRFIERTIEFKDLQMLVTLLEERRCAHAIEKERMKAENFLELIKYEYQLG